MNVKGRKRGRTEQRGNCDAGVTMRVYLVSSLPVLEIASTVKPVQIRLTQEACELRLNGSDKADPRELGEGCCLLNCSPFLGSEFF